MMGDRRYVKGGNRQGQALCLRQGTYPSACIIRERGETRRWRRRGSPCGWLTMLGVTGLVMMCCIPLALAATTPDLEAQVREIAIQLRCPVCQGLSVGDSPSELANEMRTLIREQLQQGKTPAEVLDYFAQRYGEWILLAPPKRGFNLVVWVLPFVLLPIGAAVVYVGARRWVRQSTTADPSSPRVDSPYAQRLQRELDSYQ